MIIILEKSDLSIEGTRRCYGVAPVDPTMLDIDPELMPAVSTADVVYVTKQDDRHKMIKSRNAPLNPYPVQITAIQAIC